MTANSLVHDLTGYFVPWYTSNSFTHRFLVLRDDGDLFVDVDLLMLVAPQLSTGEQVYAAIWWNLIQGAPAPWLGDPLARLWHLDEEHRARVMSFIKQYGQPTR